MKILKKAYPLIGLLALCSGLFLVGFWGGESKKDKQLQLITSIHTKVFSRDNLFAKRDFKTGKWKVQKRDEIEEMSDWKELLSDEIQPYIRKNSDKNNTLLNTFFDCQRASVYLIYTIKSLYNIISGGKPSEVDLNTAEDFIKTLQRKNTTLMAKETMLGNRSYLDEDSYFKKPSDAKEILLRLILTLSVTMDKVGKDFKKALESLFPMLDTSRYTFDIKAQKPKPPEI